MILRKHRPQGPRNQASRSSEYGLCLYNETFAERGIPNGEARPPRRLPLPSVIGVSLGYLSERGLADGLTRYGSMMTCRISVCRVGRIGHSLHHLRIVTSSLFLS